ncbi:tagaturonate reductase [Labilibaculum sp. DW002]|uniref:Tagaturonate reductase n=1 Tax=Paralabilibaculum antarcticum TaxID=2912572 RepID=A0ABT5VPZ3_9BACT|nr:tagaturonate reductase [Labilibaculum sp. DW002]MDE5417506.1 tagaturonate reductase [Labilibaculum sp. DW002]
MKLNRTNNDVAIASLPTKVLQFGEGNFLRAFVDWMIDTMNKKQNFEAGIKVVQPIDRGMVDMLNDQDGLYTLYLRGIQNGEAKSEHTLIDAIQGGINPYTQNDEYMAQAEEDSLRFVISNTTEAGIAFDANDKLEDKPQNSYPGKLTALLYRRFTHFKGEAAKGLIIIPCELIDANADRLKEIVLKYAELWKLEADFVKWINEANYFCNTLVDRIVPGYPKDRMPEIKEELGYEDNLVVEGEFFHLWVIQAPEQVQKEFPAPAAGLNVIFTDDITPYKKRKVRILNGLHTILVPVAYLYGIDAVRQAVEDEVCGRFLKKALEEEIIPSLDMDKQELETFAADVLDRFRNPYIHHLLLSISLNSFSKFETRVLPTLLAYQEQNNEIPQRLSFALAAMLYFYRGKRNLEEIPVNDSQDVMDLMKTEWAAMKSELEFGSLVKNVLAYDKVWKRDLNEVPGLCEAVTESLQSIHEKGMNKAIESML